MDRVAKIARGALADPARGGRHVPWKLTHPGDSGPWPVVLWSHGLGGSREGAGFLARHLAARGIAALHLSHPGTSTDLWEGTPGHPWDVIRATPVPRAATLDRFGDVPFVLSRLVEVDPRLDRTRAGISGHSFGALTAQVAMGQPFPDEEEALRDFTVPGLAGAVAYSPNPMGHLRFAGEAAALYAAIRGPILFLTGTEDRSPFGDFGPEARIAVHAACGAADKELVVLEGADHMVFAGSRGQLGPAPDRAAHEAAICDASAAFWRRVFGL